MEFTNVELISGLIGAFVLIISSLWFLIKMIAKMFDKKLSVFERSFALLQIEIESTDAALASHFDNGYADKKAEHKKKLIQDYDFTHRG